ncbi:hypothetical protein EV07_1633 [Prochlorococcus sp. MIT 0603]|nr:hypothetical protein EV07_1633 [Prochlorococcus sp. MIT 0603]
MHSFDKDLNFIAIAGGIFTFGPNCFLSQRWFRICCRWGDVFF